MRIDKLMRKIDFFADKYEDAKTKNAEWQERFRKCLEQYNGDGKNSATGGDDAKYVWNITHEIIDSKISTNIPSPRVSPRRYSETTERNAQAVERLCNQLRDALPFERLNDEDERCACIYGTSVWLVEWDDSIRTHDTVGDIRITVISPRNFVPQPGIASIDDMDYLFVRFQTSREELCRRYGISRAEAEGAGYDDIGEGIPEDEDTVTVITCYYKNENDDVCEFSWSEDIILSDIEDYYSRRRAVCRVCNRSEELCECEKPKIEIESTDGETLRRDIALSDGQTITAYSLAFHDDGTPVTKKVYGLAIGADGETLYDDMGLPRIEPTEEQVTRPTVLPYYKPKRFPVVLRRNTAIPGELYGMSDCELIRPQQEQVNKINTRLLQKLMRSGITPIMPDDAVISSNNAIFGQVIRMAAGQNRSMYGIVDTTPDISRDMTERENQYRMAKRNVGITESFQGNADSTAQSGTAKQAQIAQSAGRLDAVRQQKQYAFSELDALCFQLYLSYADEPRPIAYRNAFGRVQNTQFNRYDFLEYDADRGKWYFYDSYMFSVDRNGSVEQQRDAMWQLNLSNLQQGTFGNPQSPETLLRYWQAQEREHYPHARENVEYFTAMVQQMQQAQAQAAQQQAQAQAAVQQPQMAKELQDREMRVI